jgi:hypothetical protein
VKREYPRMVYFRDIPTDKRVCCGCGHKLVGRGEFLFEAILPGKYFCHRCSGESIHDKHAQEGAKHD